MKKDQEDDSEGSLTISEVIQLQDGLKKDIDFNKSDEELTPEELAKKHIYLAMDKMVEEHVGTDVKVNIDNQRKTMERLSLFQDKLSKLTEVGREIEKNFLWQNAYLVNHFEKGPQNEFKLVVNGVTNDIVSNKEWSGEKRVEMANTVLGIIKAYKEKVTQELSTKTELISILLPAFEKNLHELDFDFYNEAVANGDEMKAKYHEWLKLSKELSKSRVKAVEALKEDIALDEILPRFTVENDGDITKNLSGVEMKTKGERLVRLITEANKVEDEIESDRQGISVDLFGKADDYMDFKKESPTSEKQVVNNQINPLQDKAWFRLAKVLYIGAYGLAVLIGLIFCLEDISAGFWFLVGTYFVFLIVKKAFYYVAIGKTSWE